MILQKILMVSFQMYIVFFGDRVISQIIFGDVLPEMVGNMQLRQVSKILKAYPTSMRNRSNCKAFRTFMNNPQTNNAVTYSNNIKENPVCRFSNH